MAIDKKKLEALGGLMIDPKTASPWSRLLFYGGFGSGKTSLVKSTKRKTLLIDSSEGYFSLLDDMPPNLEIMKFQGVTQLEILAQALKEQAEINGTIFDHEVVVLDEASVFAALSLDNLVRGREKQKPSNNERDAVIPEQRDYLANERLVGRAINALFSAPCHVVILSHPRLTEIVQGSGVYKTGINFAPGLANEVNRTLHVIGYLSVDKDGKRAVRIVEDTKNRIEAKNRLGLTEGPPELDFYINKITGRVVEANEDAATQD